MKVESCRQTRLGCLKPMRKIFPAALLAFIFGACQLPPPPSHPAGASLNPAKFSEFDQAIAQIIADKQIPGAVLWLERQAQSYHKAFGNRALAPSIEPMTEDTIFDLASLTKVVAGTPAIMLLVERGKVNLDDRVHKFIPDFFSNGKDAITVRQLLTHTSGLRPDISTRPPWSGQSTAIRMACDEKLLAPPGTVFRYSDINLFLVGEIVQRVSGKPLEQFCADEIYRPLKMDDTGFLPPKSKVNRIAPTEKSERGEMLRGVVHDPTSRFMGGVAGHAGLFSTAHDLARYARMMLNEGTLEGVHIFKPETVRLMRSVQSPENINARRGLGWDIDSPYSRPRGRIFPIGSFGHTGFTGTILWIDPFSKTFYIFLSNRVHPDGKGNVVPLYSTLGTLAAESVAGFDFANVAGALKPRLRPLVASNPVLNGIDVLKKQSFRPLKGLRVGLITNHTGVDRDRNATIDLLKSAPGVELKVLFSPEHGIRGEADERVDDTVDQKTGLPVYSLYGARRAPTPEQLHNLDALVFDIQDIGCRFYTYPSTMGNCMEAAARAHLKFFVLDRVNPINGLTIEGPIYHGPSSFTAFHSTPLRHGMTVGELAQMFNVEKKLGADLTVIKMENWSREMFFDQTGLPWVNPSPNMRSLYAAILYPGLGLHETALSVGRGTGTPFEIAGAPYINDLKLAAEMNSAGLEGIRFMPVRFTPTYSTFKDQPCAGVAAIILEREKIQAVDIGLELARALQKLNTNEFALAKVGRLLQDDATLAAIKSGKPVAEIKAEWNSDLADFKKRREKFLLYK